VNEDLILAPEVHARRLLRGRRIRLQVLVPHGAWIGCGTLRVLRLKMNELSDEACPERSRGAQDDKGVEMIVGYESYKS
jgi:hypothetical protein